MVHVPTLAINEARALAKLGRLDSGLRTLPRGDPHPEREILAIDADRSAAGRGEGTQRIVAADSSLKIILKGASSSDVAVTIDGAAVPQALFDAEQLVDPGERHVEGKRG